MEYTLDIDRLLYNKEELIYYIDNNWTNKEEFTNKLKDMFIIRKANI